MDLQGSDTPKPTYSDRGFAYFDSVDSTYGAKVDVYESSAASGPHLWVGIEGEAHLREHAVPHVGLPWGKAKAGVSAHLTMDQARDLLAKLDAAIKHSEARFDG